MRSKSTSPQASSGLSDCGTSGGGASELAGSAIVLARHVASRHWALLDRKNWLAGLALKGEDKTHLGADQHGRDIAVVAAQCRERRLRCHVIIPDIVMGSLVVPDHLAGRRA